MDNLDYYCAIETKNNDKILFFDIYDKDNEILYNGSFLIKDRSSKIDFITFNSLYYENDRKYFFKINEEKFNIFLELIYNDLIKIRINDFLIKYRLEEYAI